MLETLFPQISLIPAVEAQDREHINPLLKHLGMYSDRFGNLGEAAYAAFA